MSPEAYPIPANVSPLLEEPDSRQGFSGSIVECLGEVLTGGLA
jgi:hypothetical protein